MLQIKDLILKPQLLREAAEKLTEEQRRGMWPPEIGHQYHNYLTHEFDRTQLAAIEVRMCACIPCVPFPVHTLWHHHLSNASKLHQQPSLQDGMLEHTNHLTLSSRTSPACDLFRLNAAVHSLMMMSSPTAVMICAAWTVQEITPPFTWS